MARRKAKDHQSSSIKTIKRYGNRKLYDTQNSRYVTLDEISTMVRNGEDICVIDNRTNEDLTSITLTQIMLEEEKNKKNALPLSLLKNLIQQSGESLADWVQKGKDSLTTMTQEGKEQITRIIEKGHETREESSQIFSEWITNPQKSLDFMQKSIDERIKYFFYHLTGLDDLEKQILELENKINGLDERLSQNNKEPDQPD